MLVGLVVVERGGGRADTVYTLMFLVLCRCVDKSPAHDFFGVTFEQLLFFFSSRFYFAAIGAFCRFVSTFVFLWDVRHPTLLCLLLETTETSNTALLAPDHMR